MGFSNDRNGNSIPDTTEVVATAGGYSDFAIGPWEGNLSLDGRIIAHGNRDEILADENARKYYLGEKFSM